MAAASWRKLHRHHESSVLCLLQVTQQTPPSVCPDGLKTSDWIYGRHETGHEDEDEGGKWRRRILCGDSRRQPVNHYRKA